ncbi:hypothetical protein Leryth_020227 [Lithospermum erythrorhizon]|nr:hypothetical protein Leryth_020227 [Lithospermum erythrorhizon]
MPSYHSLPRGISLRHLEKFIPKKWKLKVDRVNDEYESMVNCLLTTLKDFVSQGNLVKAFRIFNRIRTGYGTCEVLAESLSSLLLCCTNNKSLAVGKKIHAHILSLGLGRSRILVPKLITFYTSMGLIKEAHVITMASNIFHPLPWNLLIYAYVKNDHYEEALSVYSYMGNKGVRPDKFTYPSVLKACGELSNLEFGAKVHKSIDGNPSAWNLFVQNALISMYAKCGEVGIARGVFEKMIEKDAVSWNTMIGGYASNGKWPEAFEVFERMYMNGVSLNIITWNTMAGGCLRTDNFRGALEMLAQMEKNGIGVDHVAVIIGLSACSHIGLLISGKEIHGLAIRRCHDEFVNVKNALINMYARCNDLMHGHVIFSSVEVKNIITWNSIISGYTHLERSDEASFLFREMLFTGVQPNYVTIASILPLCARVANLHHGREFHCYITRRENLNDHLLLWNSLVDMYARSGKLVLARILFDMMRKRDVVTYTSMIAGYGIQGQGDAAINLFEEMIRCQIHPDHITMIAVLSACSHSRLVIEGQLLFEQMQTIYGINPCLEHFACMVDLFGRAGLLKKAAIVIRNMPYNPTAEMWATLLGACRIHGNMEIGEWAAEKLLEMRPDNPGYYVLIANLYAATGCWSKLATVRTFMRDLGVRKDPGCAWVDIGAGFFPFVVDDTSSSQADEMYTILWGLLKHMKDAGYVASQDSSFEEEMSLKHIVFT